MKTQTVADALKLLYPELGTITEVYVAYNYYEQYEGDSAYNEPCFWSTNKKKYYAEGGTGAKDVSDVVSDTIGPNIAEFEAHLFTDLFNYSKFVQPNTTEEKLLKAIEILERFDIYTSVDDETVYQARVDATFFCLEANNK